jgi:hypothetical protein
MFLLSTNCSDGIGCKPTGCVILLISLITNCLYGSADTAPSATFEPTLKRVLVIYSDERLVPANVIEDDAIRRTFATDPALRVEFYSEFLDVARFGRETHEQRQADFFREKYAERPPDLIITAGQPALLFLCETSKHAVHAGNGNGALN